MKVSVLTPIYRTDERYLREAIESVLGQTFADFEFLLLDDCPEDNREAVVRSYNDRRIVYLKNDRNLGIAASRNRLIDLAKGEYLAIFDHDDICRPERLAKQVSYLDANPECGVIGGWTKPSCGTVNFNPEGDHAIKLAMMAGSSVWHPASMIRKSLLDACHVRYEAEYTPVEDYMLWMRLIPYAVFHNLQEVVLDYRWHEGNTSVVRKRELEDQVRRVQAWAKVNLPELYLEFEMSRKVQRRVRLFGIPVLKIETEGREIYVRLFDKVPFLRISRRYRV